MCNSSKMTQKFFCCSVQTHEWKETIMNLMLVHLVNAVCVYHKDVSNLRAECSFYMLREDEVEVEGGGTELLGGVFWDTTM